LPASGGYDVILMEVQLPKKTYLKPQGLFAAEQILLVKTIPFLL